MILASDGEYRVVSRSEVSGHPNLIRVFFEDGSHVDIQLRDYVNLGLKVLEPIPRDVYESIVHCGNVARVLLLAIRFLSYQMKTSAEVTRFLQNKGIDNIIIAPVLEQLQRESAIDDERYTALYVSSKRGSLSRRAMIHRLAQRGVSPEVVKVTVNQLCDDESELQAALQAAKKYMKHKRIALTHEDVLKMAAHLDRKGFSSSVIYKIIDNMDITTQ